MVFIYYLNIIRLVVGAYFIRLEQVNILHVIRNMKVPNSINFIFHTVYRLICFYVAQETHYCETEFGHL